MSALSDLVRVEYPRSSAYDLEWLVSLDMGPNPLWLLEDLSRGLHLEPGMRVLDLGCGRGATSVFLAREFGVEVWAADLRVPEERLRETLCEAGVADTVHAVRSDARNLPFPVASFDVIVSVDSWEYFGTDDHFLPYLTTFLNQGGQVGVATPAMTADVRDLGAIPDHIRELVGWRPWPGTRRRGGGSSGS